MLQKFHDPMLAIADKLTSQNGSKSIGNTASLHDLLVGVDSNTDRIESNFGSMDFDLHTSRGISIEAAAGLTVERRCHHMAPRDDLVAHRKRKKGARTNANANAHAHARTRLLMRSALTLTPSR